MAPKAKVASLPPKRYKSEWSRPPTWFIDGGGIVIGIGKQWRFRDIGALGLAVLVWIVASAPAQASNQLQLLSSDPYTNTSSQHKTEVEPDTFASGSTIVSAFQVGRFFDGGASNIGFATSTNGGKSWTSGFLPSSTVFATPAGIYGRASDPSVAFDAKHNIWLISFLGLAPNGASIDVVDVLVSRSTDGGVTWSGPVAVSADGLFNDKNWTTCDNSASSPFFGHCYTEFDVVNFGDLEQMSTSADGGQTWAAPLATKDKVHGIGGQPLVQPDGTVIVPFDGFSFATFLLMAFRSTDGGASWSAARVISPVKFRHPAGGIRAGIPLPSAEMDASGRDYVIWSDCRFEPQCSASDLLLTTTTNGVVWTHPTLIPADPVGSGVDHFIPGLAVNRSTTDGSAQLVLAFYYYPQANCTKSTCELQVGFVASANGGSSWTRTAQIAGPMSMSWLPSTSQGFMVGDYISTSFSGGPAFPAFALAGAPNDTVFDEATFTVRGGLAPGGVATPTTTTSGFGNTNVQPTTGSVTTR